MPPKSVAKANATKPVVIRSASAPSMTARKASVSTKVVHEQEEDDEDEDDDDEEEEEEEEEESGSDEEDSENSNDDDDDEEEEEEEEEASDDGEEGVEEEEEEDSDDDDDDEGQDDDVINTGREDVVDDLTYDVYNLMAADYHALPINSDTKQQQRDKIIKENATRATQLLVDRLFNLPSEMTEVGPVALLPSEKQVLPREKRVPEPKPETRWEKFAKEKGIKKKKRERMIFDEDTQEYRPRYGYKRAKSGIEETPIVEVKHGADPYADPWAEARAEKKERVQKNTMQQFKNQKRAEKAKGKGNKILLGAGLGLGREYDPARVPGIPIDVVKREGKRGKDGVRQALQIVQQSTASMGRFDEMRKGEPMKKLKGKKRSFRDNLDDTGSDRATMKANLRIVHDKVDKKKRGVTNSLAAYEGIIPDAPERFHAKKGKTKSINKLVGGKGKKPATRGSKIKRGK